GVGEEREGQGSQSEKEQARGDGREEGAPQGRQRPGEQEDGERRAEREPVEPAEERPPHALRREVERGPRSAESRGPLSRREDGRQEGVERVGVRVEHPRRGQKEREPQQGVSAARHGERATLAEPGPIRLRQRGGGVGAGGGLGAGSGTSSMFSPFFGR